MSEPHPPPQPAGPPPLPLPPAPPPPGYGYRAPAAPPDFSRAFPVQAAKASLYSALFAFLTNFCAVQGGAGMPAVGHVLIAVLCGVMIIGGFVLGIVALSKNRLSRFPGVTAYAVAGIAINGFFLLANAFLWGRLFFS